MLNRLFVLALSAAAVALFGCGGGGTPSGSDVVLEVQVNHDGRLDTADVPPDVPLTDTFIEVKDVPAPDAHPDTVETVDSVPEALDLPDAIEPELRTETVDTVPETLDVLPEIDASSACAQACSFYQVCNEDSGECVDNPLCAVDFCTGAPKNTERLEMGGSLTYIDRYEWPNAKGQVPQNGFADVGSAATACLLMGKRMCYVEEYVAACSAGTKYPYGNVYMAGYCNTEHPYELSQSGAFPKCRKPGGTVFDIVGNLVEWTGKGRLFGGSYFDGIYASCSSIKTADGTEDKELLGVRCCLSPSDDLDGDGFQASMDCNDLNANIYPGAEEKCDLLDNNCDGLVDNAVDFDNDGWNHCVDCNDAAAAINPGAFDAVGDGYDLNCDGVDGMDKDHDGFMSKASGGDDCNDENPTINPGHAELCDGLDNDCDGRVDDNLPADVCDDKNACTKDSCDLLNDKCLHNIIQCNDKNGCTADTCDSVNGCVFTPVEGPCDDGYLCTLNDSCSGGTCIGFPKDCTDGNVCTENMCDPFSGDCIYSFNEKLCDDGNPCSVGDFCRSGQCISGDSVFDCNDGNQCTTDKCEYGFGCRYTIRQGLCNDGDPCTENDLCILGKCTAGTNVCGCTRDADCVKYEDGNQCNGTLFCNKETSPAECVVDPKTVVRCSTDFDSQCRKNTCEPADGMCYLTELTDGTACSDGLGCTQNDGCKAGVCRGSSCDLSGLICINDGCMTRSCVPNQWICDGLFSHRQCNSTGTDWLAKTSCSSGHFCENGQCHKQVCQPDAITCAGTLRGICNTKGSGIVESLEDCASKGLYCLGGICVQCVPQCDGRNCGEDKCGSVCGTCSDGQYCSSESGICTPLDMVFVAAGTFVMGSPDAEVGRDADEAQTEIKISRAFGLMRYEVTQGEFNTLMGYNLSAFSTCGATCPVEMVSWHEALAFANERSLKEGLAQCFDCTGAKPAVTCQLRPQYGIPQDCPGYRLPTEAEWEYAARAGTTSAYPIDGVIATNCQQDSVLESFAWYCGNAGQRTHAVGQKQANYWGLYDAAGNVWEWVWDWYSSSREFTEDPCGPPVGSSHVIRGGSWQHFASYCRSANRDTRTPGERTNHVGFRLARTLQ